MGWNSWDYFGTTLTEQQAREQAEAMAKYLLPAGYDVFTVDIQWYEPESQGHGYKEGAPLDRTRRARDEPRQLVFNAQGDDIPYDLSRALYRSRSFATRPSPRFQYHSAGRKRSRWS